MLRGAEVVLAAAAVAATVPAYRDFFGTGHYLVPLLAATGAGILVAVLTAARRCGTSVTVLCAVAGFVAVAAVVIQRGRDVTAIGTGVAYGWMRMLTTGLPAGVDGELLMLPALLVYAAGFGSATVALRTRAVLGPLPFPLLPLLAALLLTAGQPVSAFPVSVAVLVPLTVLLLVRAVRLGGGAARAHLVDRARWGLPVVATAVAAGVTAAYLAPIGERGRFDPRAFVRAHLTVEDVVTPLATVRSQRAEKPARAVFTVRVSGAGLDRVRTAALDDYDGSLWRSGDRFLTAGPMLTVDPGIASPTRVRLEVSVTGLDGPHLPAVGWPRRVTAGRIGFCAGSGVLAAAAEDRAGLRYDLDADVRSRDDAARSAGPDPAAAARLRRPPPEVPAVLTRAAERFTAGASTPFARLEALERGLRSMPYTPTAPPGHSLDRLGRLFTDGPERTMGDAEQYAAAFAVLARSLGFPARVVTGYLLRPGAGPDAVHTVRTSDAWAWAEVDIAGYGWMTFDPADERNRRNPAPPPEARALPDGARTAPSGPGDRVDAARPPQPATRHLAVTDWLPPLLALLSALLVALPAAVVTEKWRRGRARRRGSPAHRIVGAWKQSTGRLREAGLPVHRSWTPCETAAAARDRFGAAAAPVATLAPLVAAACYGHRSPAPESADAAWRADRALRAALRRDRGLLRTARAWLHPASLWHRADDR
ncbi:hypothetical protein JCM9533A_28600 [Catenuloplanes niger JCM 9533]